MSINRVGYAFPEKLLVFFFQYDTITTIELL